MGCRSSNFPSTEIRTEIVIVVVEILRVRTKTRRADFSGFATRRESKATLPITVFALFQLVLVLSLLLLLLLFANCAKTSSCVLVILYLTGDATS
jgi:hypothetical protein